MNNNGRCLLSVYGRCLLSVRQLCRFIATYNDVKTRSPDLTEDELLTSAADVLRSSGVSLRTLDDVQKVRFDARFIIIIYLFSDFLIVSGFYPLQCINITRLFVNTAHVPALAEVGLCQYFC